MVAESTELLGDGAGRFPFGISTLVLLKIGEVTWSDSAVLLATGLGDEVGGDIPICENDLGLVRVGDPMAYIMLG